MVRRTALQKSGLFDLAFDHGARADADLGMRLYLSGARMILNPAIRIFHHHAPRGGLRVHKARLITYASSRSRLTHRSLPSATELYLIRRYFTLRQLRESLWQGVFASFSLHDVSPLRRLLKAIISFIALPGTLFQLRQNQHQALQLSASHPTIPNLK
jgi:GT2 family glycosyltransferase